MNIQTQALPDNFLLLEKLTHASPSPEGTVERGVGGPHAPHPQPRPGGKRAGRFDSPLRSARGWRDLPPARGPGRYGPPLYSLGQGRRGPQRRGRGPRRGRSCKQPQRPGLASKSPASQAPPRAAGAPRRPRGHRSRGPGERRGVRSPSWRATASRRAVPAAEKGEVRTYLSLLSTPSWIHLSTSPQSIMDLRCTAAGSYDPLLAPGSWGSLQGPATLQTGRRSDSCIRGKKGSGAVGLHDLATRCP
ncbi:uncharacterized protein LOC119036275 [Artibeus jamaicensis]|uniref:uncharacterized protein LOC119036275 n=1 Tax=Artibeus jamaicensis TaxID=9417 RepID=UPI00235AC99E|nr:uncharacterized protein LOC119036275 [Artibeus jamaicensis]